MNYDVNTFDSIAIRIASPEIIRKWSKGEVRKPETINYRTLKPEKDGLFCEKIFGPTKDYECACGKYKRIKHKGITCDRCGVEVTQARVRRERMGHIDLVTPVSHIWFFKTMPSRIGNLLDLSVRALEKVLYYEEYIVIDPKQTPLKARQLLTEEEYHKAQEQYGPDAFDAMMGAEAVQKLLAELDLDKLTQKYQRQVKASRSKQSRARAVKTLKIVEAFRKSGNRPEWMILKVIPVIPPDLRPLVALDGGRFATSDLNDLYRRVINRNNRLRKLLDLKAPDVIIRNEKRMLQEAVDALFDNGRHGRPVLGAGNRPLKSLSDMLKGKQGRFRQNLLGKRVDYSGRSVIVIGPELKLHQCGLPKKMALELFEPFIIRKLKERGHVHTIRSAKKMVERVKPEVWDILEEVIHEHPVMLNRAPTLHRLGIQAFEPLLIEGNAIRIHPLVCTAFNADFDGDQMAVHVPLSMEAMMETRILMLSANNIFSPASGNPIMTPTQDIVLGIYYLTKMRDSAKGEGLVFGTIEEAFLAYQDGEIQKHAKCKIRLESGEIVETTMGRIILNEVLPKGFRFVNEVVNKGKLSKIIADCYHQFGHAVVVDLLDRLKSLGFEAATDGGISIGIGDIQIPEKKENILAEAHKEVKSIENQYKQGIITDGERKNKIIDIWTHATDRVSDIMFEELHQFNPIFMMADSGARGSKQQIRQLAGMRGLMAKPSGEIIENPITANFREGLTVLDYFISTHGARKGLADIALKTADSGYLTRRLVDVAQDVIIMMDDCGTLNGIVMEPVYEGEDEIVPLSDRILGRVALDNVVDVITDQVIVKSGGLIDEAIVKKIDEAGIEKIRVRSVLCCEAPKGVCAKCYGRDLATRRLVELGTASGIIAAQSIGEPGTQLTMRTFHIGGTASRVIEQSYYKSRYGGTLQYHSLKTVVTKTNEIVVLNRNGQISIHDSTGRELERYTVPTGAIVYHKDGETVKKDEVFVKWDPYTVPILTEVSGKVRFEDIKAGVTMDEETDLTTGMTERVIIDHKEELHPQLVVVGQNNEILAFYPIPTGAHIIVKDGQHVTGGTLLAKTPRKIAKTRDITGGLPRVAELFEARKPKNPAIISEIDGVVEIGEAVKGQRKIVVKSSAGMTKEYLIPHGKHLNVYKGDKVVAGQQLVDGPVVPQDILRVSGERSLQAYLVNEVQEVYRLQGVKLNDKHVEVIVRQMLRKVRIEEPGDTDFLVGSHVEKLKFAEENAKMIKKGKKPAVGTPILLGITKASLTTDSFISAASFQETTRVLTEAASAGKRDFLQGLKENVIMGHLIPAGTGFKIHQNIDIEKDLTDVLPDPDVIKQKASEEAAAKEKE
ncbi:MAG: DNA-directed RNA polymerase subunit beta' [Candidatus Omnitrophica bacterium ADurb.Bin277]|nr:MAG: DNA-directed RNA polymerase subunit beta' [Candidatus Omnitrophica bacterium ADurb.Bin277]